MADALPSPRGRLLLPDGNLSAAPGRELVSGHGSRLSGLDTRFAALRVRTSPLVLLVVWIVALVKFFQLVDDLHSILRIRRRFGGSG
jgi:hypothetical protein